MIWFNDEDFDHKSKTPAITSYIEALSIRKDLDNGKPLPMLLDNVINAKYKLDFELYEK